MTRHYKEIRIPVFAVLHLSCGLPLQNWKKEMLAQQWRLPIILGCNTSFAKIKPCFFYLFSAKMLNALSLPQTHNLNLNSWTFTLMSSSWWSNLIVWQSKPRNRSVKVFRCYFTNLKLLSKLDWIIKDLPFFAFSFWPLPKIVPETCECKKTYPRRYKNHSGLCNIFPSLIYDQTAS